MRKIFVSPHNDDEALFGAFTIMSVRDQVEVAVVFDSYIQPSRGWVNATAERRREETRAALSVMGVAKPPIFLGCSDMAPTDPCVREKLLQFEGCYVYYPAKEDGGHAHHNLVADICSKLFPLNSCKYLTYTATGKSTSHVRVLPKAADVRLKLLALACYETQIEIPDCRPHFLRSIEEYYA